MPPHRAPTVLQRAASAERYRVDRLRLRHLRLLEAIDRTQSLRRAAEYVGVSQPAASLLLREIETVFGVPLVTRNTKGCQLAAAGRVVLDRLSIALSSVDRAVEASRHPEALPRLRLGSVQLAGTTFLPAALGELDRDPDWGRLAIKEGRANELILELASGELDCVIGWIDEDTVDPLPLDQFKIVPLWPGRMDVIAATDHPLLKRRTVSVDELAAARWIVATEGTRMHAAYVRMFVRAGRTPPLATIECSAVHTTLSIVSRTKLLAMSPDLVVSAYANQRMVKVLRTPIPDSSSSNVSLIYRRDSVALDVLARFQKALLASAAKRAEAPVRSRSRALQR